MLPPAVQWVVGCVLALSTRPAVGAVVIADVPPQKANIEPILSSRVFAACRSRHRRRHRSVVVGGLIESIPTANLPGKIVFRREAGGGYDDSSGPEDISS